MNGSDTQNMDGMPPAWHLRLGIRVLSRFFDLFVVWPATIAAACLLSAGMFGVPPAKIIAESVFNWGETSFRSAPAGLINVPIYEDQKQWDGEALPQIEKKISHVSTDSVEHGKVEFSAALSTWYWRLVARPLWPLLPGVRMARFWDATGWFGRCCRACTFCA